VREYFHQ